MITIIHGENTVQSRQKLLELESSYKAKSVTIKRLEAKSLGLADLETALGSDSLFGEDKVVVIEELHSQPKSAKQDGLFQQILAANIPIILWEKRALTKTMLSKLKPEKEFEFKLPQVLFKWLDSVSGDKKTKATQLKLLHQVLAGEDEQLCFIMLIRQIRLLIQAKDNFPLKGAPFMVTKLKKQSQSFTLEQLLSAHSKLLSLDMKQKTSATALSLGAELDILLLQL